MLAEGDDPVPNGAVPVEDVVEGFNGGYEEVGVPTEVDEVAEVEAVRGGGKKILLLGVWLVLNWPIVKPGTDDIPVVIVATEANVIPEPTGTTIETPGAAESVAVIGIDAAIPGVGTELTFIIGPPGFVPMKPGGTT
jgi:hypothetical protein